MSAARREVWLRNNRRALALGMIGPLAVALVGLAIFVVAASESWWGRGTQVLGLVLAAFGLVSTALIAVEMLRPRLAYRDGHLLIRLRSGPPVRVPLVVVECFLLGQGPSMLSGPYDRRETATLVVRLDERATDWAQVDVKPALGSWCGGQVTIRGTWCEPLSVELVRRLNARLGEITRDTRATGARS